MTKTIKATGYMIQDRQGNAIYAVGPSVDEAWAKVVRDAGPFWDRNGDEMTDDAAFEKDFRSHGASAALIAQVEEEGGCIGWGMVDGVACTVAEAEAED
jgi:hypothetical protein